MRLVKFLKTVTMGTLTYTKLRNPVTSIPMKRMLRGSHDFAVARLNVG
jgi:hypothetical protein